MKLSRLIATKLWKEQLPHFLIIKVENERQWREEFIDHYCLEGHQTRYTSENALDLFLLNPTELKDTQKYSMQDVAPLFHFLSMNPMQWKHRLVIIESAHRLTDAILNKLLKTLEEAPNFFHLIFLTEKDQQFLETVHSRAIHLEDIARRSKSIELTTEQIGPQSPNDIQNIIRELGEEASLKRSANWGIQQDNAKLKVELIEMYKDWERSSTYGNPLAERAVELAYLLSKYPAKI